MAKDPLQITVPDGFLFSTAEAAIKKPGRKDLALIYSEREAVMSGMFTTNNIKAAPVMLDIKRIKSGKGQAIIINSGNANACTGRQGLKDAMEMTELIANGLGLKQDMVYACSTGVIGAPMPIERIRRGISGLLNNIGKSTIHDVAAAIMTTDTFPKVASKDLEIGGKKAAITGVCKGAGMIRPHMATMLCFIMTDLTIGKSAIGMALKDAVKNSFNKITVDGDMSTNDTVLCMANGMAGNRLIREDSRAFKAFAYALYEVTCELSRMIVKDGEGATKLIEIEVKNAKSEGDAERAAFAIANSLLVKTAIYGNDANWGRIMAAIGYSGIALKEDKTDIYFGRVRLVRGGIATGKDREAADELREKEIKITVDLHIGNASARVLTCDLTEEYVRINAEYRT
ncbi:MAG: bifunctional glutamate N-acetyltransferase/amino-acid acetyltransferase ArgJ [Thermodesulfovibrionales bacterium]